METARSIRGFLVCLCSVVILSQPIASAAQLASNTESRGQAPSQASQVNPDALRVRLLFSQTVSSANAKVGQGILLEVAEPVRVDGEVIIAAGTQAQAVVTSARHRGHNRRDGLLLLTIQSAHLADGQEVQLRSAAIQEGSGKGMPIFGPCTFPIPVDPAGLFRKGKDVVIPKGTEVFASRT
jgi:hypothetical protein